MWRLLNGIMRLLNPEEQEKPADEPLIQAVSRRGFLKCLGAIAIAQTIPYNRVWSFPTIIRPRLCNSQAVALQLEKIRHHIPVLYEREDVFTSLLTHTERIDRINRLNWHGVPWDAEIQLFGGATPNVIRTAAGADLWLPSQPSQKAHRVLPLPE